jgi:hypothetical protein
MRYEGGTPAGGFYDLASDIIDPRGRAAMTEASGNAWDSPEAEVRHRLDQREAA